MRRFLRFTVLGLYALVLASLYLPFPALAAVYYVSNTGNDANSGLATTAPWQTLAKVDSATFAPGDQVLFQRGSVFYGSVTVTQFGASGNPITFGAYATGDNPVITGFTAVTDWVDLGGNIWESANTVSALATCNLVSVNGVNTPMGRYPNLGEANGGYLTINSHSGKISITCNALSGTPDWTGAEIVIRNNRYNLYRGTVTSQSGGTLVHTAAVEPEQDGYGFFLQNDVRTLDQQNEWYYDPGTHKIRIYSVGQPVNVRVASAENLFQFGYNQYNWSLTSYVTVENIDFVGANNSAVWGWDHLSAGHTLYGIVIQNCHLSFSGESSIFIISSPLTIVNNTIFEANASAIYTSGSGVTLIKNNHISNIAMTKGAGGGYGDVAINCYNSKGDTTIEGNAVVGCGFNGIGFGGSNVTLVKNNFLDTFNTKLDDGGAIGTGGPNGAGTRITGNICINGIGNSDGTPWSGGLVCGIYLDDNSANLEVDNNTVANSAWIGVYLHNANTNNVHDNLVYNNGVQFRTADDDLGGDAVHNLIYNNQLISKAAAQGVASYNSNQDNLLALGTFDNNYYARPINEGATITTYEPSTGSGSRNLASWQAFSGQDAHSKTSPQILTNTGDFQFEYNNTLLPVTLHLSQPMMDIKGSKYWSDVTLPAYGAVVMMKDQHPTSPTPTSTVTPVINTPTVTPTPTGGLAELDLKGKIALVFPNPARTQMQFLVRLSEAAEVKIVLYNVSGRPIAQLRANLPAGFGQPLVWNCEQTAPGFYLAQVWVNGKMQGTLKVAVTGK